MIRTTPTRPFSKPKIAVFGVCCIDFVASLRRFPNPDEKIKSESLVIDGGGNAGNTACAIGRIADKERAEVFLISAVGDDSNGRNILDGLIADNVDIGHVNRYEGSSPFTYVMSVNDTRTCIHQHPPHSVDPLPIDFVDGIPLKGIDAVHFDSRYPQAAVRFMERCLSEGIPYSVDVERPREGLETLLRHASVVICNSKYCDIVLGTKNDHDDSRNISKRLRMVVDRQMSSAKIVLTTLGSGGCCLVRPTIGQNILKKNEVILPSDGNLPRVVRIDDAIWCDAWGGIQVVDATGAGDAFQGGFVASLWAYIVDKPGRALDTLDDIILSRALRIATRVAAKKLQFPGARKGLPRWDEDLVLQRLYSDMFS